MNLSVEDHIKRFNEWAKSKNIAECYGIIFYINTPRIKQKYYCTVFSKMRSFSYPTFKRFLEETSLDRENDLVKYILGKNLQWVYKTKPSVKCTSIEYDRDTQKFESIIVEDSRTIITRDIVSLDELIESIAFDIIEMIAKDIAEKRNYIFHKVEPLNSVFRINYLINGCLLHDIVSSIEEAEEYHRLRLAY